MRSDNAVPDVLVLKRFLLGQLSREEAKPIERYLEQHPEVASTLADLVKDDTLVGSLRASGGQAAADPPELAGLIDKLSQLRSVGDEATVGLPNGASSDGDALAGLASPQAAGEIGRLGGYRVLKVLGAGGMGMVYHAEDVHLQRPIALKVMKAEVAKNASARERFLREARAAAKLHSDHVVNIYQVGEDNQVVFLAMEFLEGMSLDDWLKKGRTPTLTQAARIGRQIALGLADAHAGGLIHRDIKPGNIWLDSRHQGRAKLLDFGLARGNAEEIHLTQSGAIVGTPAYMAPEQARGEPVDHRVDLFSLGVVLYRLTTGLLPFRGDTTMSVLTSLAMDTPKAPREINPNIPPRLAALIERLLLKDREQRPATAKVVAEELAAIEREAIQPSSNDGTVQIVRAASVSEPVVFPARSRSRLRKYVAAASLLLVLGGVPAAVVVIIRDPQGNKIREVAVPKGGTVEIKDDALEAGLPRPQLKDDVRIVAAPLAPLLPGEPLSPIALVRQPAKLPGVRNWSIETRNVWYPSAVAYRPDGKRLAVGSQDGSIRIWEPQTGRPVQMLLGSSQVTCLAWSPDGRVLAAGGAREKQLVHLWDAETGRLLRALEAPDALYLQVLAWSPDGRTLRAWERSLREGSDSHCLAWDAARGKLLGQYPCSGEHLAFSSDGKRLAITAVDRTHLSIRDADTGEEVRKLTGIKGAIFNVDWSPDGKRLACAVIGGVHVWEAETGKEIAHHQDAKVIDGLCGVTWSPDGRSLAVNVYNSVVLIEDAPGAKPRLMEDSWGGPIQPAWSPDSKTIARVGGEGANVRLLDVATGKLSRTLSQGMRGFHFAWAPDGQSFATSVNGQTALTSVDTGQVRTVLKGTHGPIAWSPDGKRVATAGSNSTDVILWQDGGKTRITLTGHQGEVNTLAWSPDGKRLASSSNYEKRVLLWDADKGTQLRELGPFPICADTVTWSRDGRLVAYHLRDISWHVWDLEQNRLVNDPKHGGTGRVVLAPDSRSALAWSGGTDDYRLRELATAKEGAHIPHPPDHFGVNPTPVWSPDGRLLAVPAGADVQLWRGDLSGRVRTLRGSLDGIQDVAFSADGKLVLGRAYLRLHVWETDTGRPRGILLLGEPNHGLTLMPDGHFTGNENVERGIVMVVQKDDGAQEVLEPTDFEQKYGFKNDPDKVHLLQPLPPLPPLPDGERELAEWLIKIGAGAKRIRLRDGAERAVSTIEQLPNEAFDGRFHVVAVALPFASTRTLSEDTLLAQLRKGGAVEELFVEFPFSKAGVRQLMSAPGLWNLKTFDLRGPKDFDDECLLLAAKFERLERLTVPGSKDGAISAAALEKLQKMPLIELNLPASNIDDKHVESIGQFALLEKLDLGVNPLTDAGLAHLAALKHLRWLKLFRTRVSAEGVKKLAVVLPRCEIKWDGGIVEPSK